MEPAPRTLEEGAPSPDPSVLSLCRIEEWKHAGANKRLTDSACHDNRGRSGSLFRGEGRPRESKKYGSQGLPAPREGPLESRSGVGCPGESQSDRRALSRVA